MNILVLKSPWERYPCWDKMANTLEWQTMSRPNKVMSINNINTPIKQIKLPLLTNIPWQPLEEWGTDYVGPISPDSKPKTLYSHHAWSRLRPKQQLLVGMKTWFPVYWVLRISEPLRITLSWWHGCTHSWWHTLGKYTLLPKACNGVKRESSNKIMSNTCT